jgi:hypothetical protein
LARQPEAHQRGVGAERAAVMRSSAGKEARWRPVLALRDDSGDALGSGSGSRVVRQDLLAEERSGARNAVVGVKKLGA